MSGDLLRPREVARILGVGISSVYRLAARGTLPAVKVPGTSLVRFRRDRIERLIQSWERNGARVGKGLGGPEAK